MRNNNNPTDPWGTPNVTSNSEDTPLTVYNKWLPFREVVI